MWNDWLQAATYFWVEQLVTITNESAWHSTVTVESKETVPGSWAYHVEYSKAVRAYAAEHGKQVNSVNGSEIEATQLGVPGYAHKYETMDDAKPKTGGDGGNGKLTGKRERNAAQETSGPAAAAEPGAQPSPGKPSEGGDDGEGKSKKAKKGGNLITKKEKEVRELLAQEQTSDNIMTQIAGDMAKAPERRKWAHDVVQEYKKHRTEIVRLYSDNAFFTACKLAALSPKETAKLRKDNKSDYLPKLCEFCSVLGPPISRMTETSFQLKQMAAAKRGASETIQNIKDPSAKPKAKAKSKGKQVNRSASSKNLPSSWSSFVLPWLVALRGSDSQLQGLGFPMSGRGGLKLAGFRFYSL